MQGSSPTGTHTPGLGPRAQHCSLLASYTRIGSWGILGAEIGPWGLGLHSYTWTGSWWSTLPLPCALGSVAQSSVQGPGISMGPEIWHQRSGASTLSLQTFHTWGALWAGWHGPKGKVWAIGQCLSTPGLEDGRSKFYTPHSSTRGFKLYLLFPSIVLQSLEHALDIDP